MKNGNLILIVNLGSTSTKIAIYRDKECISQETLRHESDNQFHTFNDI